MITTFVFDGALREPGNSVIESIPQFRSLAEIGEVSKVHTETGDLFESALLGYHPFEVQASPGVLAVAGMGFDPPEKSTHYCLSLMSFSEGLIVPASHLLQPNEATEIKSILTQLNTKLLTIVSHNNQFALVWEKLGQQLLTPPAESMSYQTSLPQGDGEIELRRLIDDSINLLTDLDFNKRRQDEGKPLLNCLWPWGAGVRIPCPNLNFRFGTPRKVFTYSLRLQGMARLAGYSQKVAFPTTLSNLFFEKELLSIGGIFLQTYRPSLTEEELEESLAKTGENWLNGIFDALRNKQPFQVIALDRQRKSGIVMRHTATEIQSRIPFDERTLTESKARSLSLNQICRASKPQDLE